MYIYTYLYMSMYICVYMCVSLSTRSRSALSSQHVSQTYDSCIPNTFQVHTLWECVICRANIHQTQTKQSCQTLVWLHTYISIYIYISHPHILGAHSTCNMLCNTCQTQARQNWQTLVWLCMYIFVHAYYALTHSRHTLQVQYFVQHISNTDETKLVDLGVAIYIYIYI